MQPWIRGPSGYRLHTGQMCTDIHGQEEKQMRVRRTKAGRGKARRPGVQPSIKDQPPRWWRTRRCQGQRGKGGTRHKTDRFPMICCGAPSQPGGALLGEQSDMDNESECLYEFKKGHNARVWLLRGLGKIKGEAQMIEGEIRMACRHLSSLDFHREAVQA